MQTFTVNGATAGVVAHSISPEGIEFKTVQARYPRMVHADAKTHRVIRGWHDEMLEIHHDLSLLADENLSRNGRSSRAVPFDKLLSETFSDPYVPHFLKNKPGMVASEEFDEQQLAYLQARWKRLAEVVCREMAVFAEAGVHKQWVNRPLEAFGYIDVLISGTDWENFFHLRDEAGAQPEVQDLAKAIRMAFDASTPKLLQPGDWHLPYADRDEDFEAACDFVREGSRRIVLRHEALPILRKLSVARCARLTYAPFNGEGSIEAEIKRHDTLVVSQPVHASPAEHQATPDKRNRYDFSGHLIENEEEREWGEPELHGNLRGWIQYRKLLPNEAIAG
ncbi:hypothetical protein [Aureimonas sp. AU40]|uniref:hypothetical protein n=1 Tax=Aureimonas sp. AU40 TaxID=1637747 RepID=UPI0007844B9B|nr:hypothetical protein [Aureimonas sp. AU40]